MVDKRANFIKLAEIRVNNLINAIRLVKNLSNKNNYSYDPDQVNRILKVIKDDVRELEQEFKDTVGNTKPGAINFMYTLGTGKHQINQHIFLPQIGDFFIFPASLHHSVNTFQSKGERVSVSGNLKII